MYEELRARLERDGLTIMEIPGVHSVGIGKDGDGRPVLRVHAHGTEVRVLSDYDILKGCEIANDPEPVADVLRIAKGSVTCPADSDMGRYRPMLGGIQITLHDEEYEYYGTLGCFVVPRYDFADPYDICLLSCRHVLKGTDNTVYQSLVTYGDEVAEVSKLCTDVTIDAGIARMTNLEINNMVLEEIGKIGGVCFPTYRDIGRRVVKRGRTTKRTIGIIQEIECLVRYGGKLSKGEIRIKTANGKAYSDSGDSGSPVVFEDDNTILGIHCAGDGGSHTYGYATSMEYIFDDLDICLWEG